MHSSASWLQVAAEVLTLAAAATLVVMRTRDLDFPPAVSSKMTRRQRFGARYERHPRLLAIQVACLGVAAILWISYWVAFLV